MYKENYDLLIVGAGPMGIATAIEAKKNGLSAIIIEKGFLVNSIFHFPKNMTFFSSSEKLEIGSVPFLSINEKPKRDEALEYYRRVVKHWELNVHLHEEVIQLDKKNEGFEVSTNKQIYYTQNVVLATGFYGQPNLLNVSGENLDKVRHYYNEPHEYLGRKVAIIGAGNSACQAALELYHKDVDVTMIIRDNEIKPTVKYWIKPNIENRIKEGSIKAMFKSEVVKILPNQIEVQTETDKISLDNDIVLALIGYRPNYDLLQRFGIRIDGEVKKPCYNNFQESNVSGVYLAGVMCGGLKTNTFIIENSREHAVSIVNHILNVDKI